MRAPAEANLTAMQRKAADRGWKALMPIGGRPFVDFILDSLANAGCREVGLVLGPDQWNDFEPYMNSDRVTRTRVTLLEQADARGSADAVLSAADWVNSDPFLVLNGDNLYPDDALSGLTALEAPGLAVFERQQLVSSSNIPAEKIAAFAVVELRPDGTLKAIVEKPASDSLLSTRLLISMNAWRFDGQIFDACRDVELSPRGEYELPVAVQLAVDRGVRFASVPAHGPVLDMSSRIDVPEVTRRLSGVQPRP
jgi:glucose-1-phosphate thymidylyltransferase